MATKSSVQDQDYITAVLALYHHADDERLEQKRTWDELWRLYNNQYDFSKKADWQSKNFVPKIAMGVEAAAASLKRALIQTPDFFGVEAMTEEDKPKAILLEKLIKYWLDQNDFNNQFVESLKSALLTSLMVFKVYAVEEEIQDLKWPEPSMLDFGDETVSEPVPISRRRKAIRIDAVDPYDFWIDPTGRGKYVIQRSRIDLDDLKEAAESGDYDQKAVSEIEESFAQAQADYEQALREGKEGTPPPFRKSVELLEFWGDLPDQDGNLLFRNGTITIANQRWVIRGPIDNPYLHRKVPFVWGAPTTKPFSVYHRPLFRDIIGLARMQTELLNLILDGNIFAVAKAFELDLDQIYDPNEIKAGVYPGKVFKKRGSINPGMPMIREINIGAVPAQALSIYQLLDREIQGGTGINEIKLGLPAMRGQPTATEVQTRTAEANSLFDTMSRGLEEQIIEPILDMVYKLILQYMNDFTDPSLKEMLGQDADTLQMMSPRERFLAIKGNFKFKARGISIAMTRSQELDKVMTFLRLVGRYPQALQGVNVAFLLKKVAESLNWDPKELLTPQFLAAFEQAKQQNPAPVGPGMPGIMPMMPIAQPGMGLNGPIPTQIPPQMGLNSGEMTPQVPMGG